MPWIRQLAARLTQSRVGRQRAAGRAEQRRPLSLEPMEPRIMLSGDPNAALKLHLGANGSVKPELSRL